MERNPAALAAWLWVAPEMKKPPPCPLRASRSGAVQQAASAARGCAELVQPAVIFYRTQTIRKAVRIGGEKPQTPLSARLPAESGLRMPLPAAGRGRSTRKKGKKWEKWAVTAIYRGWDVWQQGPGFRNRSAVW